MLNHHDHHWMKSRKAGATLRMLGGAFGNLDPTKDSDLEILRDCEAAKAKRPSRQTENRKAKRKGRRPAQEQLPDEG